MKFTIITVCYNAQLDIKRTMESVLGQTYTDFQYIIKDGQSSDNTLQIVQETAKHDIRVVIESGKDGGIYDAMNQAVLLAEGEYIFFLNAGDTFHDSKVLEKISSWVDREQSDVIYGDILYRKKDRNWVKKYRNSYRHKWIYLLGDCICHQAMFSKREMFVEKLFNTKYRICADREWQLFYLKKGVSFLPVEFIVADVLVDGFSLQNVELFEKEAGECLEQYYPMGVLIYKAIYHLKKITPVRMLWKKDKE